MKFNSSKLVAYLFSILFIGMGIVLIKTQSLMFGVILIAVGIQSIVLERYLPSDSKKDERHKLIIYRSSTFTYIIETIVIFTLAILYSINIVVSVKSILIILIIFNTIPFVISSVFNARRY